MAVFTSEVTSDDLLGNDISIFQRNFISNLNGTEKLNSISENPTKIKVK